MVTCRYIIQNYFKARMTVYCTLLLCNRSIFPKVLKCGLQFCTIYDIVTIIRFGHSSVLLPNGDIVLIGGFGISELSTTHRRLNDVLLFHKSGDHYACNVLPMSGDTPGVFFVRLA